MSEKGRAFDLIEKVTLRDIAGRIGRFRAGLSSFEELVEWSREAIMAPEFPEDESDLIMEMLQDISASSEAMLGKALETHDTVLKALSSCDPPDVSRN